MHVSPCHQVCEDRACSDEEVEGEVKEILAEMGHSMFLPAVRFIALLLRPFIRSALHGIFVNREGLEQVNECLEKFVDGIVRA